jgi:hypothetical protein
MGYISAMYLVTLLAQAGTPGDCILSGLCGVVPEAGPAIPAGVMYLAVGLVVAGTVGWRRARRAGTQSDTPAT